MSILDLQRRIAEAGRIRIGQQVPAGNGRTRPEKLTTFRITSADRHRIEQAAELYGGTVEEWQAPAGPQWQVITATDSLDVVVPPSDLAFSQAYELWSAGGCVRRCDGATETIGEQPCVCDAAARECDIHTRLSVMLRDLPGLGVFRLDTTGYYAAVELASAVQIIALAAGRGMLLPARLRLEQRVVKRPGANGKPQTLRFAVPVLDVEITPAQLLSGANGEQPLELATRPRLTPVPALTGPQPSIAEQSAPPAERPARKNAAPEIPASGRSRRTRTTEQPAQGVVASAPEDSPATPDDEQAAPAPASPPTEPTLPVSGPVRPRRATAEPRTKPGDADYWNNRVHAVADERGFDHDALRLVAAAVCGIDPAALELPEDDADRFSVKQLVDAEWERIDKVVRSLPENLATLSEDDALDAVSRWGFPIAKKKQLPDWDVIDAVAFVASGKRPDEMALVDWVAFFVRLLDGEYDAHEPAPVVTA